MPWPCIDAGTSVWVKAIAPALQPVIGDGDVAAGVHLEAVLGLVVADSVGHAVLTIASLMYNGGPPIASIRILK